MSLRSGSSGILTFTGVHDNNGNAVADVTVDAWAATTAYDIDDVVTDTSKTYKCTKPHTSGAAFDADDGWKEIPSQAILPLMTWQVDDSAADGSQLFQDEGGVERTLDTKPTTTAQISFARVQGSSAASKVADLLERGYTGDVTIYMDGYPMVSGDEKIEFAAKVTTRSRSNADNLSPVNVTFGGQTASKTTRMA